MHQGIETGNPSPASPHHDVILIPRIPHPQEKKIRVAVYCRVSGKHEDQEHSLQNQIHHYEETIGEDPNYELTGIYYDFGISGFKEARPGFQRMLAESADGKFDLIITKSITRFARNTGTVLHATRLLRRRGIGVYFELQRINTLGDGGELLMTLLAAFGQAESEANRTGTQMAIRRKAERQEPVQQIQRIPGYTKNTAGEIIPDEDAGRILEIFEMAAAGIRVGQITNYLNHEGVRTKKGAVFYRATVTRILQNEEYKGDFVQYRHYVDDNRRLRQNHGELPMICYGHNHPPVVTRTLWKNAQRALGIRRRRPQSGLGGKDDMELHTNQEGESVMTKSVTVIPASRTPKAAEKNRKNLRVAAYCRVSTEQEEQLGSFENQVSYYAEFIGSNPDWVMAGIFSDEGISGTGAKKRPGFQSMIRACREGKIDRIITKSISRFARNTADCLNYSRELKNLGISIFFQKENIDTMTASGELLFTILSSLAQEESRNISENTAWGIRSRFKRGMPMINTGRFMGYDKNSDGELIINPEQAGTVKRIFREFLEGWGLNEIAARLNREQIPGVSGEARWNSRTIRKMLQNEKYKGDLRMQKTYTVDFLTRKTAVNRGERDQYYVQGNHEAIVVPEDWEAVQQELMRRDDFMKEHGLREISSMSEDAFFHRVYCGKCGCHLQRRDIKGSRPFWRCPNGMKENGNTCTAKNVLHADLRKAFVITWNRLVESRDKELPRWGKMAASSQALTRIRGEQMIELTAEGPLEFEIPELTRMVLLEIIVISQKHFTVRLLDGAAEDVRLG